MPALQTSLQCPACKVPQTATVEQVIDVGRDPGSKIRLLQGRLNFFHCAGCGFQGTLALPLVYHDPVKDLLLTYVPVEMHMTSAEQDQTLGRLTEQVVQSLAPELRKGYLLRPQMLLTMQGLLERILEADGITREMLDAQHAKSKLVQDLIAADSAARPQMIAEQDQKIDADVLSLLNTLARAPSTAEDKGSAERIIQVRDDVLKLSTAGKRMQAQRKEVEAAAKDLESLGQHLSLEALVKLVASAPSLDRVTALATFAWQAMDYSFFQKLSEMAERSTGAERERLTAIRDRAVLEVQRIQQAMQSEMKMAAGILQSVLQAPDMDQAVAEYLPEFNDLFFAVLEANLENAHRNKQEEVVQPLEQLKTKILSAIEQTIPPEWRLLRELLKQPGDEQAEQLLKDKAGEINDALISALRSAVEDSKAADQEKSSLRLKKLLAQAEKHLAMARFGPGSNPPAGPSS